MKKNSISHAIASTRTSIMTIPKTPRLRDRRRRADRPLPSWRRSRPRLEWMEDRTLLSTFLVSNAGDSGPGSLRQAILDSNAHQGANVITFDPTAFATPQTITLTSGQLELSDTSGTETITGPAAGVTVSGNVASRVFQVDSGVAASISGLTIIDGNASTGDGGGLLNYGTTTLTDCSISRNFAKDGGGLDNRGGTATLTDCAVTGNEAVNGAGTYNLGGTIALTNCTINSNGPATGGVPSFTTASSSSGFSVSNSDLLQTNLSSSSVTGNIGDEEGLNSAASIAPLTDGQFGPPGLTNNPGPNPELVIVHNGVLITYNLDTGTNPQGYTVTNINTYAGWRDGGRSQQDYTVLYSTVNAPNTFQVLDDVSGPSYDTSPSDSAVFLTSSTGALASNVASIEFSFPNTQNGYVGYRELDVLGLSSGPYQGWWLVQCLG